MRINDSASLHSIAKQAKPRLVRGINIRYVSYRLSVYYTQTTWGYIGFLTGD